MTPLESTTLRAAARRLRDCERTLCVDVDGAHEVWLVDWTIWQAGGYDAELALQEWAGSSAGERDGPILERYVGGTE